MKKPIISVSGLRGIIGESLDPILAVQYVCAFAGGLGNGAILLSRDGRATGSMLAGAIISGLEAIGSRRTLCRCCRDTYDGYPGSVSSSGRGNPDFRQSQSTTIQWSKIIWARRKGHFRKCRRISDTTLRKRGPKLAGT